MDNISEWFLGQRGKWKSFRRYFYPSTEKIVICESNILIEGGLTEDGCRLKLTWDTSGDIESTGEMLVEYLEDQMVLKRSRGYFTDSTTLSQIEEISSSCIKTHTEYNGQLYSERIETFPGFRTRETLGWKLKTGGLILIGQYYERKVE